MMPDSKVKVAIRLRPPLPGENIFPNNSIKIRENQVEIRNYTFKFDVVFPPSACNKDIYTTLVEDKIKNIFEGFNLTILAYGATGSGKTFTMGTASRKEDNNPGLIPLALFEIFNKANMIANKNEVLIKVSFFEIYLESSKDLLKSKAQFLPGDSKEAKASEMMKVTIKTYEEAMKVLKQGISSRTTGVTAKNAKSSRSHAFFVLTIKITDKSSGETKYSKFQLIDLAGSERAGLDTTGKELKQGININKGLSALGRVISSLSKREAHIPYRDSLLTRYLQDSFGGNSFTVMVTCINSSNLNVEETLSSLRYSSFAKKIKNVLLKNCESTDNLNIEQLKSEIEYLKKNANSEENANLKKKVLNLNEHLKQAKDKFVIIHRKIMEIEGNISSCAEKASSKLDQKTLKYLEEVKEDIGKLLQDNELFSLCSENLFVLENLDASSHILSTDKLGGKFVKTESLIETVEEKFLEMEINITKNFQVLYDFLQCEEELTKADKNIVSLMKKRDLLCKDVSTPENHNELKGIEENIKHNQQIQKLFTLAVKKKKEINQHYEMLEQKYHELKAKLNRSFLMPENKDESLPQSAMIHKNSLNTERRVISLEEKVDKCLDFVIVTENDDFFTDEVVHSVDFLKEWFNVEILIQSFYVDLNETMLVMQEEFQDSQDKFPTLITKALTENIPVSEEQSDIESQFVRRLANCQKNLELYKKNCERRFNMLKNDNMKVTLKLMIEKLVQERGSHPPDIYDVERSNLLSFLQGKPLTQSNQINWETKKELLDLNSKYETNMLILLEAAKKSPSSSTSISDLPRNTSTFLQELWEKRTDILESKCKEVDDLKHRVQVLEQENRRLRLRCASREKTFKRKKTDGSSMMEEFLSEDELSFTTMDSEKIDPDFRGTPMYKRNKPKRKSPEEGAVLLSPKASKTSLVSGCSCPGDCGTMRCSCKKKKKDCSAFCECNKTRCMNTPLSNKG